MAAGDTDYGALIIPRLLRLIRAGHPHYVWTDEETIVHFVTDGATATEYVNPEDDPRVGADARRGVVLCDVSGSIRRGDRFADIADP